MSRLLGWPVRLVVTCALVLSLLVDGAGTVPWLPADIGGWRIGAIVLRSRWARTQLALGVEAPGT